MGSRYGIEVTGADELNFALRLAARELRGTDQASEIYKVGPRVVNRYAIPTLRSVARTATPQAHITTDNAKAKRGRYPKMEITNKSGNFRPKRSRKDAPRYGAIYYGSLFGGSRFGGRKGDLVIEPTRRRLEPMVRPAYERAVYNILRKAKLI